MHVNQKVFDKTLRRVGRIDRFEDNPSFLNPIVIRYNDGTVRNVHHTEIRVVKEPKHK